jgi:formylglycine-generating enzyme required for sulfatase activity
MRNSIGMKLVRIPAGTFTMGSPPSEPGHEDGEEQHRVTLTRGCWLGACEVTQGQFAKVMRYNPSHFSKDGTGGPGAWYEKHTLPAGGKDTVPADTSAFPVENVSWDEANAFCKRLGALAAERGRKYRLPTEAEWEHACRGRSSSYQPFHVGDSLSPKQANFYGNYPHAEEGSGDFLGRTRKVGSYKPNGFGVYDMHGNVWEWCADWYRKDAYTTSDRKDPQGPAGGVARVIRGGGPGLPRRALPVGLPVLLPAGGPLPQHRLPRRPGCAGQVAPDPGRDNLRLATPSRSVLGFAAARLRHEISLATRAIGTILS